MSLECPWYVPGISQGKVSIIVLLKVSHLQADIDATLQVFTVDHVPVPPGDVRKGIVKQT